MKDFLLQMIKRDGPLPFDRYMALCLGHPQFGYYMRRDPFGAQGDFTTSPEINQIFGELIGIWCVAAWEAIGSPEPFALVELGPGRGTLMADLLRATVKMKEFHAALQLHLVEMSPVLRGKQKDRLGEKVTWHDSIASLPELPMIFIANEFFDALPVKQVEVAEQNIFERDVAVVNDELVLRSNAPEGKIRNASIYELSPVSTSIAQELGARVLALGGAGLVIDYGHLKSGPGSSVQALRQHKPCGILEYPFESDLTAHVDFARLSQAFKKGGTQVLPFKSQADFLNELGFNLRLAALLPKLTGKAREDFEAGARRLIDESSETSMGKLFKVMCVAQRQRQPLYPFEVQ